MGIIAPQEVGTDWMQLQGGNTVDTSSSPDKTPGVVDRLFDVTLVRFYMSELVADASMIGGNNGSPRTLHEQLQRFVRNFNFDLKGEPSRLIGSEEYLHPWDVLPLARIGAVTWGLSDLAGRILDGPGKHEIISALNELSARAMGIAVEYTPLREMDAIQRLFASFRSYFSAQMEKEMARRGVEVCAESAEKVVEEA